MPHLTPREQHLVAGSLVTALTLLVVVLRGSSSRTAGLSTNLTSSARSASSVASSTPAGNNGNGNDQKRFQLYMNPVCPFVQRTRITISELQAMDLFTFTPIPLRAEIARAKFLHQLPEWSQAIGINSHEGLQHLKDWYMQNMNKGGDVPVLMDHNSDFLVTESEIVSEYIYLNLNHTRGVDLDLFPSSSFLAEEVVRFRYAIKTFPASAFYSCLRNQDPSKDAELFKSLRESLGQCFSHMSPHGPYFVGPKFTFADIFCFPHMYRFATLLKHYRGYDLFAPCAEYDAKRVKTWFTAVSSRPSVQKTCPTPEVIIKFYEGEANDNLLSEKGFYGRGRSSM